MSNHTEKTQNVLYTKYKNPDFIGLTKDLYEGRKYGEFSNLGEQRNNARPKPFIPVNSGTSNSPIDDTLSATRPKGATAAVSEPGSDFCAWPRERKLKEVESTAFPYNQYTRKDSPNPKYYELVPHFKVNLDSFENPIRTAYRKPIKDNLEKSVGDPNRSDKSKQIVLKTNRNNGVYDRISANNKGKQPMSGGAMGRKLSNAHIGPGPAMISGYPEATKGTKGKAGQKGKTPPKPTKKAKKPRKSKKKHRKSSSVEDSDDSDSDEPEKKTRTNRKKIVKKRKPGNRGRGGDTPSTESSEELIHEADKPNTVQVVQVVPKAEDAIDDVKKYDDAQDVSIPKASAEDEVKEIPGPHTTISATGAVSDTGSADYLEVEPDQPAEELEVKTLHIHKTKHE